MMHKIPVIQYLPLTRPKATQRFVKKLDSAGVMSILDLEDSAQDPFDISETVKLKKMAREGLISISESKKCSISSKLYIRLNAVNTEFFEDDIKAVLQACGNKMPMTGVFLPKVENYSMIEETSRLLHSSANNLEIVPMIETVEGMKNLGCLLEKDKSKNLFNRIHYGHFDYCLDTPIWPFTDPDNGVFWDEITPMVDLITSYGKTYIHTPFPFPNNESLFWAASQNLVSLFPSEEIWICTLNAELSLSPQPEEVIPLELVEADMSQDKMVLEAKNICDDFLTGRANKRSFGISDKRFIPPHQYFAAKNYLDSFDSDYKRVETAK